MSDAWMPGVRYVRAAGDGGPLKGGAPRVVWQALDADPQMVSARSAAQCLDQHGRASHLVWNPHNGEIVQLIPIVRAARSLASTDSAGSASWSEQAAVAGVTAEGRICVQICVVAFADHPFTARPMAGLLEIMTWLDSWGVSRRWPAGAPARFPECLAIARSRRLWARGGHFGASQVPGLTAAGPGAIDVGRLTGWSAGHAGHPAHPPGGALPVGAAGPTRRNSGERTGIGYDPADLGAFLGNRVASATALTRVR